ncbi:MAG: hypothetical protein IIC73_00960 [Armatimonadetes bacterium]|nr:hypothetical protein [Armatimonadota bacterium]
MNWKRLGITALTLCAVAALIYGIGTYSRSDQADLNRYASRLEEARAAARQAGLATEISDILTPERKEGLKRYERLLAFEEYLQDNSDLKDALLLPSEAEHFPRLLKEKPEVFDVFFESASIVGVSFPKNWERGLLADSIEYNTVNRLAQFATMSATIAFEDGDRKEALRLIEAGVHFSSEIGDEPITESVQAWASSANRLTRTIYRLMERDPTDPHTVETALKVMKQLVYPQPFTTALRGDILCYIVSARDFDKYDEFEIRSLLSSLDDREEAPEGRHRPEAFETASIEFWIDALRQLDESEPNLVIQGILLDSLGLEWAENRTPSQFLSKVFPVTYEQIAKQIARSTQLQRLVYTVAQILSRWQASGELPAGLPEQSLWTTDPSTGDQFYYEKTDAGFTLQAMGGSDPAFSRAPVGDLLWVPGQGYGLEFTLPSRPDPAF